MCCASPPLPQSRWPQRDLGPKVAARRTQGKWTPWRWLAWRTVRWVRAMRADDNPALGCDCARTPPPPTAPASVRFSRRRAWIQTRASSLRLRLSSLFVVRFSTCSSIPGGVRLRSGGSRASADGQDARPGRPSASRCSAVCIEWTVLSGMARGISAECGRQKDRRDRGGRQRRNVFRCLIITRQLAPGARHMGRTCRIHAGRVQDSRERAKPRR
ncbi:hypothetical protein CC85DRAFT_46555 [Cutaneotrichosporon oleaginosum]|uniref:Uncharacterized protein n=1 Tax=Cutaneotrichosporon oleaginosum TaxID=879819 RepID=A0A0J1B7F1_9TREE|nr:uncharacterized protein CC85DRAFT_46555 [Cutaneotrichosporon oleaginosum]KLT43659.1 hypothetical protein CC85DRAFT_46555 [Cutaneotrichosporon oleaginosum]TXT12675.1 hypothetical protein COLE_03085 [Cutaneotrichosporon oleaginosum]